MEKEEEIRALLSRGKASLLREDYATARERFEEARALGSGEASYLLARLSYNGEGENRDPKGALSLFFEAAERGSAEASCFLGFLYEGGEGILEQNLALSRFYYEKAAKQGHPAACYSLALGYEEGYYGEVDLEKAVALYEKAALGGVAPARERYNRLKKPSSSKKN